LRPAASGYPTTPAPASPTATDLDQLDTWIQRSFPRSPNQHRAITYDPHAACGPIEWTATVDEIIEKVRYVTARMEQLVNAVQIGDVMDKAA